MRRALRVAVEVLSVAGVAGADVCRGWELAGSLRSVEDTPPPRPRPSGSPILGVPTPTQAPIPNVRVHLREGPHALRHCLGLTRPKESGGAVHLSPAVDKRHRSCSANEGEWWSVGPAARSERQFVPARPMIPATRC